VASLGEIIAEYNECVLKRIRYLKGSSEENPLVVRVTNEIETLWPTVRQNMESVLRNAELRKKTIEDEYKYMTGRIANTPTQERVLTGILRQQTLQSELYLTLLQKREENVIQLYSTVAKGRLIDTPVVTGVIGPQGSTIILVGFLVGLFFPILLFVGMDLLRFHIAGRKDVVELTNLPILADIPLAKNLDKKKDERAIVVRENYNDVIEEGFRDLRTNIGFVLKPEEKVIIVTSCIPCEGKTFVASNLAMSLALLGKKVVVVGCDLRKPSLVALFGFKPTNQGIVNFLCTSKPDYTLLDNQIIASGIHKNMDVLPAGIIPPNPSELLSGALLEDAISYLSSKYDYVILDTPPVGLVSDTLSIGRLANLTIFVARTDFTPKSNFDLINSISKSGKLPKCNVVINGVDFNKRRYAQQYGHYGHYRHYSSYGNYAGQKHDVRTEK
jgi:capsular exopolysaccharide synthesis family protein